MAYKTPRGYDRGDLVAKLEGIKPKAPTFDPKLGMAKRFQPPTAVKPTASFKVPEAVDKDTGPSGLFGLAIDILDFGRTGIVSTLKEGIDLVQGEGFSFGDWKSQVDEHYGFGDLINDERTAVGIGMMALGGLNPFLIPLGAGVMADNIWADRAIGFIGDVAVDPLTYMGGLGVFNRAMSGKQGAKQLSKLFRDPSVTDDVIKTAVEEATKETIDDAMVASIRQAAREAVEETAQKTIVKGKRLTPDELINKPMGVRTQSNLSRTLAGKDDAGRLASSIMGYDTGLRFRVAGTGPLSKVLRQDRWVEGLGKKVFRQADDWYVSRQLENVPQIFRARFGDDALKETMGKIRGGTLKQRAAASKAKVAAQKAGKFDDELWEIAGTAARTPLEVVVPSLGSLGKGIKFGARAGLGAKWTMQAMDFPIRGFKKVAPDRFQNWVHGHFNPEQVMDKLLKSGDANQIALGLHLDDFARFGRSKEQFFTSQFDEATENIMTEARLLGIDDAAITDFLEQTNALSINNLGRRGVWWDNLPQQIKNLPEDEYKRFARTLDDWVKTLDKQMTDAYGTLDPDTGEQVWRLAQKVRADENMPYRAPRRLRENARSRLVEGWDPSKRDPEGFQEVEREVHGRLTPASQKSRGYKIGEFVQIHADADMANPNSVVKHTPKGSKKQIDVLAVNGKVVRLQDPQKVGKSFRRQIDDAYEVAYGEKAYEEGFSVLADSYKTGMGRDLRVQHFMRRLQKIFPAEELEYMVDDIAEAANKYASKQAKWQGKGGAISKVNKTRAAIAKREGWRDTRKKNKAEADQKVYEGNVELNENRQTVQDIDEYTWALDDEVTELVDRLEEMGLSLSVATKDLTPDSLEDVAKLRQTWTEEVERVILEAEAAGQNIDDVTETLNQIKAIREELERMIRAEIGNLAPADRELYEAIGEYDAALKYYDEVEASVTEGKKNVAALEKKITFAEASVRAGERRAARAADEADLMEYEAFLTEPVSERSPLRAARSQLERENVRLQQAEADVEAVKQRVAELKQKPLNATDARAKKVIDDIDARRAKAKAKVADARAKQREVVGPKVERFEQSDEMRDYLGKAATRDQRRVNIRNDKGKVLSQTPKGVDKKKWATGRKKVEDAEAKIKELVREKDRVVGTRGELDENLTYTEPTNAQIVASEARITGLDDQIKYQEKIIAEQERILKKYVEDLLPPREARPTRPKAGESVLERKAVERLEKAEAEYERLMTDKDIVKDYEDMVAVREQIQELENAKAELKMREGVPKDPRGTGYWKDHKPRTAAERESAAKARRADAQTAVNAEKQIADRMGPLIEIEVRSGPWTPAPANANLEALASNGKQGWVRVRDPRTQRPVLLRVNKTGNTWSYADVDPWQTARVEISPNRFFSEAERVQMKNARWRLFDEAGEGRIDVDAKRKALKAAELEEARSFAEYSELMDDVLEEINNELAVGSYAIYNAPRIKTWKGQGRARVIRQLEYWSTHKDGAKWRKYLKQIDEKSQKGFDIEQRVIQLRDEVAEIENLSPEQRAVRARFIEDEELARAQRARETLGEAEPELDVAQSRLAQEQVIADVYDERPPVVFNNRDDLDELFEVNINRIETAVNEARERLKLVVQAVKNVAEMDQSVVAVKRIRRFLSEVEKGAGGYKFDELSTGLPIERVRRWEKLIKTAVALDKELQHEAFVAGTRNFTTTWEEGTAALKQFNDETALLSEELALTVRAGRSERGYAFKDLQMDDDEFAQLEYVVERRNALATEKQELLVRQAEIEVEIEAARTKGDKAAEAQKYHEEKIVKLELKLKDQIMAREQAATEFFQQKERLEQVKKDTKELFSSLTERDTALGVPAGPLSRQGIDITRIDSQGNTKALISDMLAKDQTFDLTQEARDVSIQALKDALKNSEWGPWTLLSKDQAMNENVYAVINAYAAINDPKQVDGFWKAWDGVQTWLKAGMIATPGFVQRNIMGAFFNAWVDGVNLNEIMKSMSITSRVAKHASSNRMSFYDAAKQLAKTNDDMVDYVELLEVGVRGGGQAVSAVDLEYGLRRARNMELLLGGRGRVTERGGRRTRVVLAPWSPRFAPYAAVRRVNSWAEDMIRIGVGMDTMRHGGNIDQALNRIAKTQFDYDELTSFERTWMRRFIPFYTWTRKNVPYQLQQLGKNPAKYNRLLAAKRNLELGTEGEGTVPDYYLEPFGIRMPFKYKGAQVYSAPDFPFQDLFRYDPFREGAGGWKETMYKGMGMTSPIIKTPLEVVFGKQIFTGIPFSGRYQKTPSPLDNIPMVMDILGELGMAKKSPSGEWKMRDHHIYLVNGMLPSISFLRRMFPNEPKYQRTHARNMLSSLLGVSVNMNTPEVQRNWRANQKYERLSERQDWKDLVSRIR